MAIFEISQKKRENIFSTPETRLIKTKKIGNYNERISRKIQTKPSVSGGNGQIWVNLGQKGSFLNFSKKPNPIFFDYRD